MQVQEERCGAAKVSDCGLDVNIRDAILNFQLHVGSRSSLLPVLLLRKVIRIEPLDLASVALKMSFMRQLLV
jgi:hypothetical protein